MHELALSGSITDLVVECARRERLTRVSRVVVEIGVAAAVDPGALLFCFPITAAETVAAGAKLVINRIALRVRCNSCDTEYAPQALVATCPEYGSFAREILAGREMRVVSFDGEWQHQMHDFSRFPGAILMTTNCLMPPLPSYRNRVFTTGVVGFPGLVQLANGQFEPLIEAALAAPGFTDDVETSRHTVGFGHNAMLGVADKVIEAVKSGALKRLVLIGGCDGTTTGRSYYSDLAQALPADWAVLTLGCGKFRVLGHVHGSIGELPRLLDMGQCNDSYSAIKVAGALAQTLGVGVNDLPLHIVLSWFEQKAVAVLLALLHVGVKNIRIGPRLPAAITPAVLQVLVEKFNIMPIKNVADDMRAMAA